MDVWQILVRLGRGVLRRRKRMAVITFAAAAVMLTVTAIHLSKEPPRFRTSATILVEARPDHVPVFQEFAPSRALPVQLAILNSRTLAESVLENLSKTSQQDLTESPYYVDYGREIANLYRRVLGLPPEADTPQRRALLELQQARMKFVPRGDTGIVEVVAEASRPQVAVDVVNTYVEVLLARTRSFNIADARVSRDFLEQQVADAKRSLKAGEDALRSFIASHGGIKVPERSQRTVGQLSQAETTLAEVEANRKIVQARLQALRDKAEVQKRTPPAPTVPAPVARTTPTGVQRLRDQLAQLDTTLIDLRTKYTDAHPRVVLVKERIAEVQLQLGDAVRDPAPVSVAPVAAPPAERLDFSEQIVALETSLQGLAAQEDALRKRAEGLRQSLSGLSRSEQDYSRLDREVQSQQNLLAMLAERLTAARIREQGEMRVVKVIDPAGTPTPVTSEKRVRFLTLAFGLALALGAGLPAGVEWLRKTVETEGDVHECTGLPVLALVPRVRSGHPAFAADVPDADQQRLGDGLIFTEAFRTLRVAVQLAVRAESLRSLLVSSPFPGEGKSTVVLNLGFAFREAAIRVVVADTDLARPTLHQITNVPPAGGLVDALSTGQHAMGSLAPMGDNMWLASQRTAIEPHQRGALANVRLKDFVGDLADRAEIVLFDSSPVLLIPDSLFLAGAADAVILVARAGSTGCRDLARAKSVLEGAGARILGVVLNEVPASTLKGYYTRYYNAYVKRDAKAGRRRRHRA